MDDTIPEGQPGTPARWGDTRVPARTWAMIALYRNTGCWLWQGAVKATGYVGVGNTTRHLWMFRRLVGPTPEGLVADHVCHDPRTCAGGTTCVHRRCVNPAHLQWVPQSRNLAPERRNRWGDRFERGAPIDVCKYGHEFTETNTQWNLSRGNMVRRCKACARETARRHMLRKRGIDPGPFAPRLDHEPRKPMPVKTHCKHGHAMTGDNVYIRPDGRGRDCMECRRNVYRNRIKG